MMIKQLPLGKLPRQPGPATDRAVSEPFPPFFPPMSSRIRIFSTELFPGSAAIYPHSFPWATCCLQNPIRRISATFGHLKLLLFDERVYFHGPAGTICEQVDILVIGTDRRSVCYVWCSKQFQVSLRQMQLGNN